MNDKKQYFMNFMIEHLFYDEDNDIFKVSRAIKAPENRSCYATTSPVSRSAHKYNTISRSAYNLSATAKKITIMAMSTLPRDLSSLTATFTFDTFCTTMGLAKGGKTYTLFCSAIDECTDNIIRTETIETVNNKKSFAKYRWFDYAKFDAKTNVCTMNFSHSFADFLKEFKKLYAKIALVDIGRLQSKYALRLFELAKSYASLAGKNGNAQGEWYFERSVEDLRFMFCVSSDVYKTPYDFIYNVIDNPLRELNNAGLGLAIETTPIKKGRSVVSIRFLCKQVAPTTAKKTATQTPVLELPPPNPRLEQERERKELDHLRELYPQEFASLYQEALTALPQIVKGTTLGQESATLRACVTLREKYGIVK